MASVLSHGLVMWGLTTLLGASMVAVAISALVGGAVSVGKAAVGAGGGAIGAAATGSGGAARWLGIDASDALGPINQRLRAEGKPDHHGRAQLQAGHPRRGADGRPRRGGSTARR